MHKITEDQLAQLKAQLESNILDCAQQLQEAANQSSIVELDQTRNGRLTRMDAIQQQAMSDALKNRLNEQQSRNQAALAKFDHSDYGFCETCDEIINPKRLSIDPAAKYCIDCAD